MQQKKKMSWKHSLEQDDTTQFSLGLVMTRKQSKLLGSLKKFKRSLNLNHCRTRTIDDKCKMVNQYQGPKQSTSRQELNNSSEL